MSEIIRPTKFESQEKIFAVDASSKVNSLSVAQRNSSWVV